MLTGGVGQPQGQKIKEESISVYADIFMMRRVKLVSFGVHSFSSRNWLFSKLFADSYLQILPVLQLLIILGFITGSVLLGQ